MISSKNAIAGVSLVPAVDRAAQILSTIAGSKTALGVSELSRMLGINKSTTHDILATLCYHRLLERDERTKSYRLGHALAELGLRVRESADLRTIAHPTLVTLAQDVDETVFLGTYREGHVTIADKEEAPHDVKITSPVGRRIHYSAAAFGKVFLAAMTDAQIKDLLLANPLRAYTRRSITRPNAYGTVLRQVRSQGYALDEEEYLEGVRAVAAPVNDAAGRVVGALCVVGFGTHLPKSKLLRTARQTCLAAERISRQLGALEYPQWNGIE